MCHLIVSYYFSKYQRDAYEIIAGLPVDQLFRDIGRSNLREALSQSIRNTARRDIKISPDLCCAYLRHLANVYKFPFLDLEMCDLIAQRKFKGFTRNDDRHVKFEVSVSPCIYDSKISKFIFMNN